MKHKEKLRYQLGKSKHTPRRKHLGRNCAHFIRQTMTEEKTTYRQREAVFIACVMARARVVGTTETTPRDALTVVTSVTVRIGV